MKKLTLVLGILMALEGGQAMAANFTVANGQTLTAGQTLAAGQAGSVAAGGTLQVGGSTNAVTITGSSTFTNSGTVAQTGTGRAIRDNSGGLTLTVTNNAGASMSAADGDVIQMNKANSNVTFYNSGLLSSANASEGGSQAIDFNAITTGQNTLYNYATGVITANEADAVRPGVNGFVYNDGIIRATVNAGSTSSSDGVDLQANSGITIVNATTGSAIVAGTGTIEGARHGITGGNTDTGTDGTFTLNVTNNLGGTIRGDNGSGINLDGFNNKEQVTIVNHGTITGGSTTGDGDGVDIDGVVNLTNTGTIISRQAFEDTSEGVTVGGGSIVNSGTIEGDNVNGGIGRGITLAGLDKDPVTGNAIPVQGIFADTSVTNSGLIRGQSDSAIALTGAATSFNVTLTNLAGGTLEGGGSAAVVSTGAQDATVVNYGTITADGSGKAVDLGSGHSQLQILGGSAVVNGDISGGTGGSSLLVAPGSGNAFSYGGVISNFASVATGAGTVTLTGANTYTGDTTATGTRLVLGNASALGTGRLLAAGPTVVYGSGLSIGNAVVLQGDTTLEVDGADIATQAGVISGAAALRKSGTGTLVLSGANTATGGTTVQAGSLQVGSAAATSASLAGDVQVAGGATLTGGGNIGGNVVNAGTVAPGVGLGTLTIGGNYTQQVGGTLAIDATPAGQSDQLVVGGKATIAGSTLVLGQGGTWAPRTNYTILTAAQGVSGQFAGASSTLVFLNPVLSYTANTVGLSLERNDIAFASTAATANERSAASALEGLGFASPLYSAATLLDAASAAKAFDQVSGELHASTRTALMDDSRYVRDAINQHLASTTSGNAAPAVDAWTAAWGHGGDHDGNDNASRLQANGSGLLLGADIAAGANGRVGAVVGTGQNSLSVDGLASSAHVTATHAGIYGGTAFGGLHLQAGVAQAWQQVDTHRFPVVGNFAGATSGSYDAATTQAYVEAAYRFELGSQSSVEPFLNVADVRLHTDGFTERGSDAALVVQDQTTHQMLGTLGLRGSFELAPGGIFAHASLGWQHATGDRDTTARERFAAGGVDSFTVDGVPVATNAGVATLGLGFPIGRYTTVDASYQGQFASHATDQGARLSLSVAF